MSEPVDSWAEARIAELSADVRELQRQVVLITSLVIEAQVIAEEALESGHWKTPLRHVAWLGQGFEFEEPLLYREARAVYERRVESRKG